MEINEITVNEGLKNFALWFDNYERYKSVLKFLAKSEDYDFNKKVREEMFDVICNHHNYFLKIIVDMNNGLYRLDLNDFQINIEGGKK